MKMTLTAFETSDIEESGIVDFESKRGVNFRKYKVKKKCFEQGIEISCQVKTLPDAARLLEKLFELAGIETKTK